MRKDDHPPRHPRKIVTLNALPQKGWMIQGRPLSGVPLKPRQDAVRRIRALKPSAGRDTYALLMFAEADQNEIETFLDVARDVISDVNLAWGAPG
jgi:hypothetical protein